MTVENPHLESARATLAAWAADAELEPAVSELFECHIFCAPLNPDDAVKAQFVEACEALGIKGLCLGLDFAGAGMVDVLATKKFRTHERPGPAIQAMLRSAEALSESFEVIRLKLEVRARPESGVPSTDEEMRQLNQRTGLDHYFEFHLKLARHAVTPESDRRLKALGAELARRLQTRVPFSCQSLGSGAGAARCSTVRWSPALRRTR